MPKEKKRKFRCPICGSDNTKVVQTEKIEGYIGDEYLTLARFNCECQSCVGMLWFAVEIPWEVAEKYEQNW